MKKAFQKDKADTIARKGMQLHDALESISEDELTDDETLHGEHVETSDVFQNSMPLFATEEIIEGDVGATSRAKTPLNESTFTDLSEEEAMLAEDMARRFSSSSNFQDFNLRTIPRSSTARVLRKEQIQLKRSSQNFSTYQSRSSRGLRLSF